jgi:hypothetical protein
MRPSRKRTASGVFALAAAILLAFPGAAFATGGSATVTPGSLTWATPAAVDFAATLNGQAQLITANQDLDISDARGTGEGWSITLTTTQFQTTSGALLALNATTDLSSTGTCDSADPTDCAMAADSTTPIAIPAAATAPAAVVIQDAIVDTGMGSMTFRHVMQLAIAANARSGVYASTWTYSLISSP